MFFAGRSNVGVEAENHVSGLGQYFHRCLRGTKNQGMCKTYLAGSTTIGTMVITVLSAILSLLLGKLGGGYQKRDETGFWSPIVHQLLLVHQLRIADCHIGQHLHKHTHKLYPVFLTFFFFFQRAYISKFYFSSLHAPPSTSTDFTARTQASVVRADIFCTKQT